MCPKCRWVPSPSPTPDRETNSTAEGRAANRRVEVVITVEGLTRSGVDVINAIDENLIFDDGDFPVSAPDSTNAEGAGGDGSAGAIDIDAGTDTSGGGAEAVDIDSPGSVIDPVEIDPIQTGLEQP